MSRTTRRFLRAINWSIIEPHRAFHDYSLARPKPGFHGSGRSLLVCDFDVTAFECPFGDFDEDARLVGTLGASWEAQLAQDPGDD
jgi:hypothetical protein